MKNMKSNTHSNVTPPANGHKAESGAWCALRVPGAGTDGYMMTMPMAGCRRADLDNTPAKHGGNPAGDLMNVPRLSDTTFTAIWGNNPDVIGRARHERAIRSGAHPRWMHASSPVHAGSMDDEERGVGERQEGTDGIAEDEVPPMVECVHADMCQGDESAHIIACSPDTEEEQNSQTEATRDLYTPMGHRGTRQTIGSHESVMGSVEPWGKAAGTFEGKALDPRRRVIRGEVRGGTLCHVAIPGWSQENFATNGADAAWKPLHGVPAAKGAGYQPAFFTGGVATSPVSQKSFPSWGGKNIVGRWTTVVLQQALHIKNTSSHCRCGTYPR